MGGQSYDSANIRAPTTNGLTVRMVFALLLLAEYMIHAVDVTEEFLHGQFEEGGRVYKDEYSSMS